MIYIFFLLLPLLLYALFAMAILFHLKKYAIDAASAQKIITAFIVISIILAAFTATAFFSVPWNSLSDNNLLKNPFDSTPGLLQPQNVNY